MNSQARDELERFQSFLRGAKDNLSVIDQVAYALQQRSFPLDQALKAYGDYLATHPDSANAAFNYAWYLARDGQFEEAVAMYRRALDLDVNQPEEVHLNIANLYMDHLGDNGKARDAFQQALELNPHYSGAHYNLGNLAEQSGNRNEAAGHFEKCLEIDPANQAALARLADTHRFKENDDPLLARLVESAQANQNSDVHFALGAAYNQLQDFDSAWKHFDLANSLEHENMPPYSKQRTEERFQRIMSLCSGEWLSRFTGASPEPVFICGMFRTGSTLLEQILAAHPAFTAGGESEFFPRLVLREFHEYPEGLDQVTPEDVQLWREKQARFASQFNDDTRRLTDKRPDNFLYAGLIKAILPSARFIVTERDWRDVALSIFTTRLGASQNYSTRLENIRHYIGQQQRLVDHWESILEGDLLRIRYEDLVGRTRETITELLHFLGEEWDERCLEFDKLDNTVKTASVWQVREPLHSRSVGRWKNYRPYFEQAFGSGLDD
ncbi:MAG: sulfotransferase [Gammaproteobacteria bacterium]|nr:sulfotransferase [Gammaproteobacteria bacterium]